jgi:hypothetical protein
MPERHHHDLPGFRGDTVGTPATHVGVGDFVVTRYAGHDRLAFVCKVTVKGYLYVRLYLDLTRTWGPAYQLCGPGGRLQVVVQEGASLPPRPRVWQGAAARMSELRPPAALVGC